MLLVASATYTHFVSTVSADSIPTNHSPIRISYDWEFTAKNGVVSGSGTESDPYVIEGWVIYANSSAAISIVQTKAYFVIRNCTIIGSQNYVGIELELVVNGKLESNTISNCSSGILLKQSRNNTVSSNTISDCDNGISLGDSFYNTVSSNTISDCDNGIATIRAHRSMISSNTISDCDKGIIIYSTNNSTITRNTVIDSADGISLLFSLDNTVTDNTIVRGPKSISVDPTSTNNTISGNTFLEDLPKQNAALILQTTQSSATVGTPITIIGTITPAQSGAVSIFWSINGSAPSLLSNLTLVNGSFSRTFNLTQVGTYAFYAHWPGNAEFNPATSQTVTVASVAAQTQKTKPVVSISASKTSVALSANETSEVVTVTGTISPFVSQTQVNIKVTNPANQVTVIPVTVSSSTFSANVTINAAGTWTIIAQIPEDEVYSSASSSAVTLVVSKVQASTGDDMMLYAGVGIAAAAVVLIALLLMMRKKAS